MIELLIAIALAGSALAGLWDLKTTEVPDDVPALMIVLGIFLLFVEATYTLDFYPFFVSLILGTIVLAAGLLLYKRGDWGGADAWILAAITYMIPVYNGRIFFLDYIYNFLIVSAAYMVVYSIVLGLMHRSVFSHFNAELRSRWKIVALLPFIFLVPAIAMSVVRGAEVSVISLAIPFILIFLLGLFWVYAKLIEKHLFRRKITTGELKPGDVLEDMVWRGITNEEVQKIRREKKFVVIKEGVRFVPAFFLALVATLLYGNILLKILGF